MVKYCKNIFTNELHDRNSLTFDINRQKERNFEKRKSTLSLPDVSGQMQDIIFYFVYIYIYIYMLCYFRQSLNEISSQIQGSKFVHMVGARDRFL